MHTSDMAHTVDLLEKIPTPFYVIYESRLRRNLEIINRVRRESGAEIIMAFKANALWKLFPVFREYGFGFAASSLNELRLGYEELGKRGHTYCLAYRDEDLESFLSMSSHITFNSLNQWERHKNSVIGWNNKNQGRVSPGLRVNPRCSVVETEIYNPALPGSRFGVGRESLRQLPSGIEGIHFHQLCESTSFDLRNVLNSFEDSFGHLLPYIKWLNMGGGHLMTRKDYDVDDLIDIIRDLKCRYPDLDIILEPGSAFTWQTGDLVTTVMDIVEDSGIRTAIIDGSFTCHMPDTLEMPYKPLIVESLPEGNQSPYRYNFGGNSCLSGDFKGEWHFQAPLKEGQRITFGDMNHYTTVKTTMFNGLQHPSLVYVRCDGTPRILREYNFDDYKSRMS